jgi:pimeloyl-ACP methyl ester carboxylesterase
MLSGTLFGVGGVGVVLSHMRPVDQTAWHAFAQTLADNGYQALAYDFRGYGKSGGTQELGKIDRDVRAAVEFLRSQDAQHVILIGASMGGTASAKVAGPVGADGLVVLSGPQSFEGLNVAPEDLQLGGVPSLWITSRGDPVTPGMQAMHDAASDPKTLHIYEGDAHGTFIFDTADGEDLARRIIEFLTVNIPPDR